MADPYFATGYIRLLYQLARADGVPVAELFRNTGFNQVDLMRADLEVPFAAQMRFCRNALTHSPPGLGLRVGNQLQLATHGVLGTALQSAADLRTALETFGQFIAVRASFFSVSLQTVAGVATIKVGIQNLPKPLIPFFSESILFTLTYCLVFYTGRTNSFNAIKLNYERPEYGTDYTVVFGEPIEFGCCDTSVSFDPALLSLRSPEADLIAFSESVRRCREKINKRQLGGNVSQSIEVFLLENPGKLWSLQEIAPLFAMSSRTLIRKLRDDGASYQAIRDRVLKRQAVSYLRSMSVESTALSLGFADASSFRRTFKRWFGVAPSAYPSKT